MFVPVNDKLNKIIPELKDQDEFDYYKSIIRDIRLWYLQTRDWGF